MSTANMVNKKLYEKYHSNSGKQYRIISKKNFTYINILPILNSCLSKKVKSILDIGCGSGTISLYLASKGYLVKGIDISRTAINTCNESANNMLLKNVKFEIVEFPKKIPNGKYDLIFFSEVLEHLPNDNLALKKINKLLNTNGTLFLSTPSKNAPLYRLGVASKFDRDVGHLRRYDVEELTEKLVRCGFTIKNIYKKESVMRNFLFLNPHAGKLIRFIKFFLVDIITAIDNILTYIFGESQIIIIAQKVK